LWWEWQVRLGREVGILLHDEFYHEMRYEDLVSDPASTCQSLCAFLGVPYDEAMLRCYEGHEQQEPGLDAKYAWRTQMPQADLIRFEAVAGELLDELDYSRGVSELSAESEHHAIRLREEFEGRPLPQRWSMALSTGRFAG
jgi:hypothetical protein